VNPDYQKATLFLEVDHWWYVARRKILVDQMVRTLGQNREARILDVGCGGGTMIQALAQHYRTAGIDLVPEAVEMARKRSGCPVFEGDIPEGVPPEWSEIEAICLFDVIEHVDDDVGFLSQASGLLKTGGYVFIAVPALQFLFGQHDRINDHHRRYYRSQLRTVLDRAGFEVVQCSYFNFLLSPLLMPVIYWKGRQSSGHNFQIRSRWEPMLERIFATEKLLLRHVRFPVGLSLLAVGRKKGP
jgi:SAM-dependent methyltransferase